ncbi:MAG TPA: hypothetical protein VGH33_20215 [Isosphaeraceae bacterium]
MRRRLLCLALASPAVVVGWGLFTRITLASPDEPVPPRDKPGWTTAVEPKPLSAAALKGLGWLAEHQLPSGGWGQGEESANMGGGGALKDTPNVADTCVAALAMIRSGSTPTSGQYKDAIVKAVGFVRSQVDASDARSLSVSSVQGTRVQQKLGPNIDTFLASILLAEVKGRMPDDASKKWVDAALAKVVGKIGAHQKADGTFDGAGWAPILAQAMCGKGVNRAAQAGAEVPQVVLARAEENARHGFAAPAAPAGGIGGGISAGKSSYSAARGDAGVALYGVAADLGVLQDSVNTNQAKKRDLLVEAEKGKDEESRLKAKTKLGEIANLEKAQDDNRAAVVARLDDKQFVSGFGSNGGEEFLSYMNIAESLVVKGGDEWKKWDDSMSGNLQRVQNGDGSWSGHHCITGRTFCTSTALLVMMADRTPIPVKAKDDAPKPSPEPAKAAPATENR